MLFNADIDRIKEYEKEMHLKSRPITFDIKEVDGGQQVRYEIEGGGEVIETIMIRQNEEVFFKILNDFNINKKEVNKISTKFRRK